MNTMPGPKRPTESKEPKTLEEFRQKAKENEGWLYVGDALKYVRLLGQRGLTKPNIMRVARLHGIGFQPDGAKWWVFPIERLDAFYGSPDSPTD